MKLKAETGVLLLVHGRPRAELWVVQEGPLKGHFVWSEKGVRGTPKQLVTLTASMGIDFGVALMARGYVTPKDVDEVDVKAEPAPGPGNYELLPKGFLGAQRLVAYEDGTWGIVDLSIGDVLELA